MLIGLIILSLLTIAQCDPCEYLKDNVVRIHTTFSNGSDENGFGFIVAEENAQLYIITADHVVNSPYGDPTERVVVYFYDKEINRTARIIKYDGNLDLSLIRVSSPEDFSWRRGFVANSYSSGNEVWYIGRGAKWHVPFNNGFINRIHSATRKLVIEMPSVQKGCSGAPIVSKNGFVGIIIEDSPGNVYGYSIDLIEELIEKDWDKPFQGTSFLIKATETFKDPRDGKEYKYITIGSQIWMAENLNYYKSPGSWCYENNPDNCNKYGRLYNWETAESICPEGWHLPTVDEFNSLIEYIGGSISDDDFPMLREKGNDHWDNSFTPGTDRYGFNALPGGVYNPEYNYEFGLLHEVGAFWTATDCESTGEYNCGPDACRFIIRAENQDDDFLPSLFSSLNVFVPKSNGYSVRCIKD